MRTRDFIQCRGSTACVAAALGLVAGCQNPRAPEPTTGSPTRAHASARADDAPPAQAIATTPDASRAWLLDEAMDAASAPRERAHASVRSRLQREVAAAEIELGMLDAALRHAARIDDWREGEVLALAAQSLAKGGDPGRARACVDRAADIAARTDGWRKERLQAEVGVAFAMLGEIEMARRFAAGVPQDLTGRVEAQLCGQLDAEEVDRQCDAFDRAIATGSFDVVRSGVAGYFSAWSRMRADPQRSARAERAIREAVRGLPIDLQIETRLQMADALGNPERRESMNAELDAACALLRQYEFTPEVRAMLVRDVARCLARHGRPADARDLLSESRARFERDRAGIVDMDRADCLRPMAEALADLGDRQGALQCWTAALEAGRANPNARPRAEDLCLTCISMARADAAPTDEMRRTIRAIRDGLKAPW